MPTAASEQNDLKLKIHLTSGLLKNIFSHPTSSLREQGIFKTELCKLAQLYNKNSPERNRFYLAEIIITTNNG